MLPSITYPESCYNCSNDCMGILKYIFKHQEDDNHANFLISCIIEDKGYYLAKYSHVIHNGNLEPCISLYKTEASKFMHNMIRLGYQIIFEKNNSKNYLTDVIIKKDNVIVNPKDLIYVFRTLEVI